MVSPIEEKSASEASATMTGNELKYHFDITCNIMKYVKMIAKVNSLNLYIHITFERDSLQI